MAKITNNENMRRYVHMKLSNGGSGSGSSGSDGSSPSSPMVVEGTIDASLVHFSPAAGQPSFDEALSAFLSGRPVLLHTEPDEHVILITNYFADNGGYGLTLYGRLCEYTSEYSIQGNDIAWTKQ